MKKKNNKKKKKAKYSIEISRVIRNERERENIAITSILPRLLEKCSAMDILTYPMNNPGLDHHRGCHLVPDAGSKTERVAQADLAEGCSRQIWIHVDIASACYFTIRC